MTTERATTVRAPSGLGAGGRALWRAITGDHDLDAAQRVQLEEACRAKDRLDKLDALLRGDADAWCFLKRDPIDDTKYTLVVTGALAKANETAAGMKQLLAALRLPDEAGKRPQQRGGARGAYTPSGTGSASKPGKVSSLDRARAAKSS